jgi:hypothetical protein
VSQFLTHVSFRLGLGQKNDDGMSAASTWPQKYRLTNGTILEATLAETCFAPGDTVVGSLRLANRPYPTSLRVFAAGMCRLDPRWHKPQQTGVHPQQQRSDTMPYLPPDTFPFWKTDLIDCLALPEGEHGVYEPPRPILSGTRREPELANNQRGSTEKKQVLDHKAFTFRFELPTDGPPTLVARSCRYYYVFTMIVTCEGCHEEQVLVLPIPVRSIERGPRYNDETTTRHYLKDPIGFQVVAHADGGLPTTLKTADWHQLDEPWDAPRRRHHGSNLEQRLAIHDPSTNEPLCVLIIANGRYFYPGGSVTLQFNLETRRPTTTVRLVQISACLRGMETVRPSAAVAQRLIWDDESLCVDGLSLCSLTLLLPDAIPYTVSTDHVEISASIIADLVTFQETNGEYGNIHLEIPCQVVHPAEQWNDDDEEEDDAGMTAFKEALGIKTSDIEKELKILTLSMGECCGIRPKAEHCTNQNKL